MNKSKLEVFQDLHLRCRSADSTIRETVLTHMQGSWHHDTAREQEIRKSIIRDEDIIVIYRDPVDGIDGAGLVLWSEPSGYRVANIVPQTVGELSIGEYNSILQDFVATIARPASAPGQFDVDLTVAEQSIDDWLGAAAAAALTRFSGAANKSTGASHPNDRARWFAFLFAAHRARARLDSGQLARWMIEVEGWTEETAYGLARDYEYSLDLLVEYDRSGR